MQLINNNDILLKLNPWRRRKITIKDKQFIVTRNYLVGNNIYGISDVNGVHLVRDMVFIVNKNGVWADFLKPKKD